MGIVPLSDLTQAQLEALEDPSLPHYLHWSAHRGQADPTLSLALLNGAQVCAYVLAGESSDGGCVLKAAVSLPGAPGRAFLLLLQALVHQAYYRFGGDYLFYTSALTPQADTLVRMVTKMDCDLFTERTASLNLSPAGADSAISPPPGEALDAHNNRTGANLMDLSKQQAIFSILKKELERQGLEPVLIPGPGKPQIGESLSLLLSVTEEGYPALLELMLVQLTGEMLLLQFYTTLLTALTPDTQTLLTEKLVELNFACPLGHFGLFPQEGQLYYKYTAVLNAALEPSALAQVSMECMGSVYEMLDHYYLAISALVPDTKQ